MTNEQPTHDMVRTALDLAKLAIESCLIEDMELAAAYTVAVGCVPTIKAFALEAAGISAIAPSAKAFYLYLMVECGDLTQADLDKMAAELSTMAMARQRAPAPPGYIERSLIDIRMELAQHLDIPAEVVSAIIPLPPEDPT